TIERIQGLPDSTRSITDQRARKIYIPQRNILTTRAARSVVLQTLGHFVLGHRDSDDVADYLRQRVESNYFAGAVLAPERAAVKFLRAAHDRKDISIEDLREVFYISYEMAAHRLTNLATEHLDLTLHFLRADHEGVVWKAYFNNDVPMPAEADGTVEGQRLCRLWGTRQAFHSDEAFDMHYQWTETDRGDFWCVTYIEPDRWPPHAVTVGTDAAQAEFFRGSDTERRTVSKCPSPSCCREPRASQSQRWRGAAWPSAKDRSQILSGLPAERPSFSKFPGVDMVEVYQFLDRHA
ncbi:MAG: ImmA/IrrE family metallo-endopeptidase, partial [Actinomycetota bacterium]